MSLPSAEQSTAARVRGLFADVIELAQVRFELFTVEARQELSRLTHLLVYGALAVVMLSFGLIFVALFLTLLFWDTQHRLLALGVFTTIFVGGGVLLALMAWQKAKLGFAMFSATRDELRHDQERMRS